MRRACPATASHVRQRPRRPSGLLQSRWNSLAAFCSWHLLHTCAANSRHTLCGTRPHMRKIDNLHGIIGGVDCLRAPAQAVGLVAVALELASRLLLLALAAHLP